MAIELHHLHPGHDDELLRLKSRIAELERMDTYILDAAAVGSEGGKIKDMAFNNTRCCVCGELVTHNEGKILQPQIYVCQFCRENARQMLQIKKFATETNIKVEIKGLNNDNLR